MNHNPTSPNPNMDTSKLVTIAIHTYEKAQLLQTILGSNGVEAVLQNVNQIQPVVSAGVRVRIKETDLPRALAIIEDHQWNLKEVQDELSEVDKGKSNKDKEQPFVLLAVDFSNFTHNIVQVGFKFAYRRNLRVVLLHASFTPYFSTIPLLGFGGTDMIPTRYAQNAKQTREEAQEKMQQLLQDIAEQQKAGTLPKVPYEGLVRDGAPDEILLYYANEKHPHLIIMGTRGVSKHHEDLIGSVAAEVIDSAKAPVLVVPEALSITDLALLTQVGVATSFDQRDLVLFDRMMQLMKPNTPHYRLFNISRAKEELGELQLRFINDYHKEHYPEAHITYSELDKGDFSEALEKFINQQKIQLIVVNTYRRSLLAKFFNPSMARRMLFHAGTPLLVMHSNSPN